MRLNCKENERGFTLNFKDKEFSLIYPEEVWQAYPKEVKNFLIDNLVHLLTINLPLIAGIKKLKYNTSTPLFKKFFHTVVMNSLPHAVEDYNIVTDDIIKQFLDIDYEFNDSRVKTCSYDPEVEEKATVLLSCGKDSLLSLAICNEIGLDPVSIYINDTVSPTENRIKIRQCKKLSKEFDLKFFIVRNELENLNDFEFWDKDESMIGYTHMVTGFGFIALPFSHYYKTRYIVIGNQQNNNFSFRNKDGFLTYPSFDQTSIWMKQQDAMIKAITSRKVNIMSVIEPLTNITTIRILCKRYEDFAKYQVSCDSLDANLEKRWCHECSKCARLSLLMKANNVDNKLVGFKSNLLSKKHKELYCLFDGKEKDCYEKSKEARDEQLLAFYMAYKNKQKGYLIDVFKKKFLKEAKAREDYLFKKFFSVHKSVTIPRKIKKSVLNIFKEELNDLL